MKKVLALFVLLTLVFAGCQKSVEPVNYFTVVYHGNGGTTSDGSTTVKKVCVGENCDVMSNCFTNDDNNFTCWNTSTSGNGSQYYPGENLYVDNYYDYHPTIDLYAIWRNGVWMTNGSKYLSANSTVEFYDSHGPSGNYAINEDYSYTFYAPSGMRVKISFSSFSTESVTYDYMTINGTRYGGTNSPGTKYSTGNSMTIQWHSDGSITSSGWRAVVSAVN